MHTKKLKPVLVALFAIIGMSSFAQPSTPKEKRAAILTPEYYTPWIGASFFTIATAEHEFEVEPVQIQGLVFFYDFGDCFVGFEANKKGVIIQMTVRLFGDTARDFIQKAIDYGYEQIVEGDDINVHTNTRQLLPDINASKVDRYCVRTQNGNVYLEVSNSVRAAHEYQIAVFRSKD